jgi:hypothetical protein
MKYIFNIMLKQYTFQVSEALATRFEKVREKLNISRNQFLRGMLEYTVAYYENERTTSQRTLESKAVIPVPPTAEQVAQLKTSYPTSTIQSKDSKAVVEEVRLGTM